MGARDSDKNKKNTGLKGGTHETGTRRETPAAGLAEELDKTSNDRDFETAEVIGEEKNDDKPGGFGNRRK